MTGTIGAFLNGHVWMAWITLLVSFAVLAKSADMFVDASVALAEKFRIPRLVIGIVLVSLATTAPELSVSLTAALRGSPEMALGNAIGSVICDDGLALPLLAIISPAAIAVIPAVLNSSFLFLISMEVLAFAFVIGDHTLDRWEGAALLMLFVVYMGVLFNKHKRGELTETLDIDELTDIEHASCTKMFSFFGIGLAGIVVSSQAIVLSAQSVALSFGIPEGIVALTLVALGTSIPEVATCVTAARKREGAVAVGNIIGADVMNICWVAGASAVANPLTLTGKELFFMFPSMFIIVGTMLVLLRTGYRLTRAKGLVLLSLYLLYLASFFAVFRPET
ncbi:MAG: calcium/sodium antiporter [Kiritimatiellia bacterium]